MRRRVNLRLVPPVAGEASDSSFLRNVGLACLATALLTGIWVLLPIGLRYGGRSDRAAESCLVADSRVGHELPDLLRAAAGDGDLGSPLQRLLA